MRRTVSLAILVAALALLPAAGAQAVDRSFWGVQYTSATDQQDFNVMQQGRVGVVRVSMWRSYVTSGGFGQYDDIIGGLASRGIPSLVNLLSNPADYTPPISGGAGAQWVQFAHDAAARYGPGGSYWSGPYQTQFGASAPIKPVTAWQVGNEPSLPKYWPTSTPAKDYATLLQITHDAIRGVDGGATIVLAGLPGAVVAKPYRGWTFLAKLYGIPGVKANFDVAAFHPYSRTLDGLPPQMKKYRRVMKRHGDKRTKVWITEFGYGSDPRNGRLNFGLTGQARMLRKTFNLFLDKHKRWKVRGVVWYDWRDPPTKNPDCSFCSSSGLLRSNFQPKPSFTAFKHFTGAP
jgi:hypothetical protein